MIIAQIPIDEQLRLDELFSFNILDTGEDKEFNELVELAAQICDCPISQISLIDEKRQWLKAHVGSVPVETDRDLTFCSHTILQNDVMVVEDVSKDERFHDNPLITEAGDIKFYAGAPIFSANGYKLGTLCIIGPHPRKLSKEEERALKILSNQASKLLELHKKNNLIRKRAAEMVALKTQMLHAVVDGIEEDKLNIATSLHEDFAQRIAGSLFLLSTARDNEKQRLSMLQSAQDALQELLTDVRDYCYKLSPLKVAFVTAAQLIKDYIEMTAGTYSFAIQVEIAKEQSEQTSNNAITSIKIIEEWLRILCVNKKPKNVTINIASNNNFEISIIDDSPITDVEEFHQGASYISLLERVEYKHGEIDLAETENGNNRLKIVLPYRHSD